MLTLCAWDCTLSITCDAIAAILQHPPLWQLKTWSSTRWMLSQWHNGGRHLHGLSQWLPKTGQVWWQVISTYLEELGSTRLSSDCGLYHQKKEADISTTLGGWCPDCCPGLSWDSSWRDTDPAGPSHLAKKATYRGCWTDVACQARQSPHHSMMPWWRGKKAPSRRINIGWHSTNRYLVPWCGVSCQQDPRPDIVLAVGYLSRFSSNLSEQHLKAAKRTLVYLKGTIDKVLTLGQLDNNTEGKHHSLIGYCDADYAGGLLHHICCYICYLTPTF
jgi:hypothetical protein